MSAIITLTTDLGLCDSYVAAMKGVILGINPEVKLIDICHTIKPQNIPQAAFILSTVYQNFPQKTIHMVIVDPGVGTKRKAIILRTPSADFVAPDNGVLSYVVRDYSTSPVKGDATAPHQTELGSELEAVAITKPSYWRSPVSSTFHGRDIFAPVAARLSLGVPPGDFGEPITSVAMLPLPRPRREKDGSLVGHVIHIDSFGNLITNIKKDDITRKKGAIAIDVGTHVISGFRRTYAESEGLLALIGSNDYLEISLRDGNACAFLSAEIGDEVRIR